MNRLVIKGSGAYIPSETKTNEAFLGNNFYGETDKPLDIPSSTVIRKFKQITGIEERRYASDNMLTSDMAFEASLLAIADAGINKEEIDYIILAHNYGDTKTGTVQMDAVPSLASRVKHLLGIENPNCIPYDVLFGCPGWIQGVIQADAFAKAGLGKTFLVIGAEILSRRLDKFDRDSMIFADGAGATIFQYEEVGNTNKGILAYSVQSHSLEEAYYIFNDVSYNTEDTETTFIKMHGRKVYEYALKHVPLAMKDCFDKGNQPIESLKKIFIHQANEKMDEAILKAFYKLYNIDHSPQDIMPMCIQWLGNSSVATVPTLFDLVVKGKSSPHQLAAGDLIMFASVGAGMNINAILYGY